IIPGKKNNFVFVKTESVPKGFELKSQKFLKDLCSVDSLYVNKYIDILSIPKNNPLFNSYEIVTLTEYANGSYLNKAIADTSQESSFLRLMIV
ncbi:hypothetical protein, partial [Pseudomonas viridiflava]|uniref:hypothetical protein n=1 Tax=Pseudomonas viridiflava TaxID=33069 RepID=UPI001980D927